MTHRTRRLSDCGRGPDAGVGRDARARPRARSVALVLLLAVATALAPGGTGCAVTDGMHEASARLRDTDLTTFSLLQRGSYWAAYGMTAWLVDILALPITGAAVGFAGAEGDEAQLLLGEPGRIVADLFQFLVLPVDFLLGLPGWLIEAIYAE